MQSTFKAAQTSVEWTILNNYAIIMIEFRKLTQNNLLLCFTIQELEKLKKSREDIENKLKGTAAQDEYRPEKQSPAAEITLLTRNGSAYPADPYQNGYNLTENEKASLDQVGGYALIHDGICLCFRMTSYSTFCERI